MIALAVVAAVASPRRTTPAPAVVPDPPARSEPDAPVEAARRRPDPLPPTLDALIVGGGPSPDANEVEIEANVRAAADALGPEAVVLFAGGPETQSVQVEDGPVEIDPLVERLGELFSPRNGRRARYRPSTLPHIHGAADLETFEQLLGQALAQGGGPLTLVLIGHGAAGDSPIGSAFLTWGGRSVDALTLAALLGDEQEALEEAPEAARPVRIVATSCFSGGLAELAFEDADPALGPARHDRCGLFSTAWDLEASGCDPDPERQRDGYAAHLFAALTGHAPDGAEVETDLDGDGRTSLLEAHTRARIASRSIDVPTTTSSRLLRALAPEEGAEAPVSLPEEDAVVAGLGAALDEHDREAIESRTGDVEASLGEATAELERLEDASDEAWTELTAAMLSRWPVLDDPYHPDYERTLREDQSAIEAFLDASDARAELDAAGEAIDAHTAQMDGLTLELALLRRWLEADETRTLARRLRAEGGAPWTRYERMRACENQ